MFPFGWYRIMKKGRYSIFLRNKVIIPGPFISDFNRLLGEDGAFNLGQICGWPCFMDVEIGTIRF
jgi:hypothetical protein